MIQKMYDGMYGRVLRSKFILMSIKYIFWEFIYVMTLSYIIFSSNFENEVSRLMGR